MNRLPPFPVDPDTLDLIELCLDAGLGLGGVLDLLSGYDPAAVDPTANPRIGVPRGPVYHVNETVRALITEVRRLRTRIPEGEPHA